MSKNKSESNVSLSKSIATSSPQQVHDPHDHQHQHDQHDQQTNGHNHKAAFTPAELSRMYGIPYTAVKRLAAEGQVPSFTVGNRTYIMQIQFEKFLTSHGLTSAPSAPSAPSSPVSAETSNDVQNVQIDDNSLKGGAR